MPVASHSAAYTTGADGTRYVVLRTFDGGGVELSMQSFALPAGVDLTARIAANIATIDQALADAEAAALLGGG